jgi:hypothetical protein
LGEANELVIARGASSRVPVRPGQPDRPPPSESNSIRLPPQPARRFASGITKLTPLCQNYAVTREAKEKPPTVYQFIDEASDLRLFDRKGRIMAAGSPPRFITFSFSSLKRK